MFKNLFLLLVFVHILGDYYFQTDKLAKTKDESFFGLMTHSTIYAGCSFALCLVITNLWIREVAIICALMHFFIDFSKYYYIKYKIKNNYSKEKESMIYVIDQLLHISGFICISLYVAKSYNHIYIVSILDEILTIAEISPYGLFTWVLMILVIAKPANVTIKKLLSTYKPSVIKKENNPIGLKELKIDAKSKGALTNEDSELSYTTDELEDEMLNAETRAGALIGFLERFIIAIFLSINQYPAIGLVLTAKSIARYDKITKNQKFAEYYLLGTLLSTLIVIIVYFLIM